MNCRILLASWCLLFWMVKAVVLNFLAIAAPHLPSIISNTIAFSLGLKPDKKADQSIFLAALVAGSSW